MKVTTLALLSGLGAALIPSASAGGEFCCFVWEPPPQNFPGLSTTRLYAQFIPQADPGDRVLSVSGTLVEPAVRLFGGTFYQHPFGGDTAPDPIFCSIFPSLCFDTFVTIGREVQPDATELSAGWPGFTDCFLTGTDVSWSVAPDDPQGLPDAFGQVLLGQFSVQTNTLVLTGFNLRVRMISAGREFEFEQAFCTSLGTPCVAADINFDHHVDIEDFLFLLGEWGAGGSCRADIDADGIVGITDFLLLLASWGPTLG